MVGTAIGAAASIGGSLISSGASSKASGQESASAQQAINQQNINVADTTGNEGAYLSGGFNAETQLQQLLGTYTGGYDNHTDEVAAVVAADPSLNGVSRSDPAYVAELNKLEAQQTATAQQSSSYGSLLQPFTAADFTEDPGYQFALTQGQQALQRAQAAGGGLVSGAAVKALTDYNQGEADQQYQNAYDRYNTNQTNTYNRLTGQANQGQTATSTIANVTTGAANNISDLDTQIGNADAANSTQQGNIASSALGSLSNPTGAVQNYLSSSGTGLGSVNGGLYGSSTLEGGAASGINWNAIGS